MGQGSPKQHEYQPNDNIGPLELKQRESIQQAQKRPSKHELNNSTTEMTEWHGRGVSRPTKGEKDALKNEKPTIKQGLAQEGSET